MPLYEKSHEAAPVPDVKIHVQTHDVLDAIAVIVFAPDDCTVTTPDERLLIKN